MLWEVSDRVFLLDHAATLDRSYTQYQPMWALEPCKNISTVQQTASKTAPAIVDLDAVVTGQTGDVHPCETQHEPDVCQDAGQQPTKPHKHRKRKASQQQTEEDLDAKYPGNTRNRAAQAVVSAALEVFLQWCSEQCACPDRTFDSVTVTGSSSSNTNHGASATLPCIAWHRALQRRRQGGHAPSAATGQEQEHCMSDATDWVALAALKHVLHPKVTFSTPPHCRPRTSPRTDTFHQPDSELVPINLFGRVVENPSPTEQVALAHETEVLLPPHSGFLMTDLATKGALRPLTSVNQRFRFLVCDPPWENASVRRSGRYQTLPNRTLLQLPVSQLVDPERGLVFLWMTNREKLHRFVHDELLAAWGLRHVGTWYWLKLAEGGTDAASSLTSMHRHPFEHLIVAAPITSQRPALTTDTTADAAHLPHGSHRAAQEQATAPAMAVSPQLVLLSVPAAEHSRKPHLGPLLRHLGLWPETHQGEQGYMGLELFAREMHSHWLAVGNEPLRFQHIDLFAQTCDGTAYNQTAHAGP